MIRTRFMLGAALLMSMPWSIHASENPLPSLTASERQTALFLRIQEQLNALDHVIEKMGLAVNNVSVQVQDKKVVTAHLLQLREQLREVMATTSESYVSTEQAINHQFAALNVCISHIQNQADDDFSSMETFQGFQGPDTYSPLLATDIAGLELTLDVFEQQINCLDKGVKYIGVNLLNKVARKIAKVNKKTKFGAFVRRSLPYMGLGLYWAWSQDHLPEWGPLTRLRNFLKGEDNAGNTPLVKDGVIGLFHKYCGNIVTFGKGHKDEGLAVFHIALGALMYPILKQDATDVSTWMGHKIGGAIGYLKGIPYEDGSLYKPTTKARMSDVIGAEESKKVVQRIIDYFNKKSSLNLLGAYTERVYTLVGPFDTSRSLAFSIAGEISALYKAKDKSAVCHVYTLHSSELVTKELKTIIKEAKEKDKVPCIVVIEDLDWLYTQPRVDATVWSKIATTLEDMLFTKKHVFILMTVRDKALIDSHHNKQLGTIVPVPYPTDADRAAYLKKELEKRSIVSSNFDIGALAASTPGCTFDQLSAVISRGLTIAQLSKSRLEQHHLEIAVAEVVQSAALLPSAS